MTRLALAAILAAITITHPAEVAIIAAAGLHAVTLWLPLLVAAVVVVAIARAVVESEVVR